MPQRKKLQCAACLLTVLLLACSVVSAGCGQQQAEAATTEYSAGEDYTARDLDPSWDPETAVYISLDGDSAQVSGSGASASGSTVTISAAGTYVLSGALDDGQIIVDADSQDKVQIVFNGATIHYSAGSPVYVKQADKVFLTIEEGTTNTVSDTADYVLATGEDEPYAAIFSKDDLTINGGGTLTVTGNYRIGIASKDDLVITGGTLYVTAAEHGIRGRDCVKICGGDITVVAGGDGIKTNNDTDGTLGYIYIDGGSFNITAGNDGIQAETWMRVTGGSGTITTGGGYTAISAAAEGNMGGLGGNRMPGGTWQTDAAATQEDDTGSAKGLKAATALRISGGEFTINSLDDAIHSNGDVTISGGSYTITTSDDGVHADADLILEGGTLDILYSYEGLEGATVTVNGGTSSISAVDDGINAAGGNDGSGTGGWFGGDMFSGDSSYYIHINGGYTVIDAQGDGIDSNGDIEISGGILLISGTTSGADSAMDYDGTANISGGVVVAAGVAGMSQGFSASSAQYSLSYGYGASQSAGTALALVDASGNVLASLIPAAAYSHVVISTPAMENGGSYTLISGGAGTAADGNGFADGGTWSGGSDIAQITLSGIVTTAGSGAMGGMGRP